MSNPKDHEVRRYRDGKLESVIAGAEDNAGTWDSLHSRAAAERIAAELNSGNTEPGITYRAAQQHDSVALDDGNLAVSLRRELLHEKSAAKPVKGPRP